MTIKLTIPAVGESIREMQIGRWLKHEGDRVGEDEDFVELETDKASMELPAPTAGVITKILKQQGDSVSVGETIAYLEEEQNGGATASEPSSKPQAAEKGDGAASREKAAGEKTPSSAGPTETTRQPETKATAPPPSKAPENARLAVTPSARRALREYGLTAEDIQTSNKRLRREDVVRHAEQQGKVPEAPSPASEAGSTPAAKEPAGKEVKVRDMTAGPVTEASKPQDISVPDAELEEVVPMSLIRRRIAARLVEAQHQAALLTTFNEADMTAVMDLRQRHRERFQKMHGVKLGFMSFFVKAVIDALKQFPQLNAEIRDTNIVFRNYYHIGIAIGTERGLIVPVLRNAERMSFAEIEKAIEDFAARAGERKIGPHELEGGTFTISNGGIYGSLLSTPIVNPPQSGVLGMHTIQERPVARDGQVVIRPMMYLALTYDHRLVDGREAVTFLRRIKETIEEPSRMLLEV